MRNTANMINAPRTWWERALTTLGMLIVGAVLLMISTILFVAIFALALGFWAYFWWQTRALRRVLREKMQNAAAAASESDAATAPIVIEGDFIQLETTQAKNRPRDS